MMKMERKNWISPGMAVTLLLTVLAPVTLGQEEGFDLLFTSNREEVQDVSIRFNSTPPYWLVGTLVRNGLALFENGHRSDLHTFDGFAKLANFRIHANGSATFSTKFIKSYFYNESMERNSIAPFLLFEGPQPPYSGIEVLQALYHGIDNMNVNVYRFPGLRGNDVFVALNDYFKVYLFDPENLNTGPRITGVLPDVAASKHFLSSAHPLAEPGTSNILTFVTSMSLTSPLEPIHIQVVRIRSTLVGEVLARVELRRAPYMHSFSVTRDKVILLAQPFFVRILCLMGKATPFSCLDWEGDSNSTLYVVDRNTRQLDTLTMENVFTMHHINAYTDDGRIIMDISAYPDPNFVGNLTLAVLRDPIARNAFPAHAEVRRYEINLETKTVQRLPLSPPVPAYINLLDLPRINENFRTRSYCFIYGVVVKVNDVDLSLTAVVKRDVCGNGRDKSLVIPNHYPSEAIFVPKPNSVVEDDGVLMVQMLNGSSGESYLAIVNARNMQMMSTAPLPTRIPFSIHGNFFWDTSRRTSFEEFTVPVGK